MIRKTCSKCKADKPLSDFNKNQKNKDGRQYSCKECDRIKHIAWKKANPDKYKRTTRLAAERWRKANPNKAKSSHLKHTYGITLEERNEILKRQDGKCAICFKTQDRPLCIDHDHVTGKVRGLLCYSCNQALGFLRDDVDLLRSAISYLESNKVSRD